MELSTLINIVIATGIMGVIIIALNYIAFYEEHQNIKKEKNRHGNT